MKKCVIPSEVEESRGNERGGWFTVRRNKEKANAALIDLYADFLLVKAPVALHNNKRYRVFIIFLITFSLRESVPLP